MNDPEQAAIEDEDLNQPTEERKNILVRIQNALQSNVPYHFWAACHLCDKETLQQLAESAESQPAMVSVVSAYANKLVEEWNQSKTQARHGLRENRSQLDPRYLSAKEKTIYRDQSRCVITGMGMFEVAHIYPYHLLCQDSNSMEQLSLWNALSIYFPKEKLAAWKTAVRSNRGRNGETPSNLLCLNPLASALWNAGAFALKPISISPDQRTLTLKFFWQSGNQRDESGRVSLLTTPASTQGLDGAYGSWLETDTHRRIKSGDTFVIYSGMPEKFPVPSFALLEMQWFCRRILALAGPFKVAGWDLETKEEGEESDDYSDFEY